METSTVKDMYSSIFEKIKEDEDWLIYCPKCFYANGKSYEESRFRWDQNEIKHVQGKTINLTCNKCESFSINVGIMWSDIKSAELITTLLETISHLSEEQAVIWVNELKYTHPTYYLSQEHERKQSEDDLKKILDTFDFKKKVSGFSDVRILLLGCNRCLELEYLKKLLKWDIDYFGSVAVDVSKIMLDHAKTKYPKIRYCAEFIEQFSSETFDMTGKKLENYAINYFEICIALKLFQSAQLTNVEHYRRAFANIHNSLRDEGIFLLSIPKATSIITVDGGVNFKKGVFKNREINTTFPEDILDVIVTELNSSGLFEDITVFYGSESSVEYYITCRKRRIKT